MAVDPSSPAERLGLQPHPEGGWFRQTWASPESVTMPDGRVRPTATLIWFWLPAGDASAWHRVASDEVWLAHTGRVVLELGGAGPSPVAASRAVVGPDDEGQVVVPARVWQRTVPSEADALVSCLVSPGFDFADFELAPAGLDEVGAQEVSRTGSAAEQTAWMSDVNDQVITEFRANHGVVGGPFEGAPILLLHSTGARSGQERIHPMMYRADGAAYLVFASKAGADDNPAWWHNLRAHPDASIEVGDETVEVHAEDLPRAERDEAYAAQAADYPGFAEYEAKTDRVIPVVRLTVRSRG